MVAKTKFDYNAPFAADVDQTRSSALSHWDPEQFQFMAADELVQVQAALRHGAHFGKWITPQEWLTLKQNTESRRAIDLSRLVQNQLYPLLDDDERRHRQLEAWLHNGVLTITRILILLRCASLPGRSRSAPLGPSSLISYAQTILPKLVALAISRALKATSTSESASHCDWAIFGHLTVAQAAEAHAGSASRIRAVSSMGDRLRRWKDAGLWTDSFALVGASAIEDLRSGRSRDNNALPESVEWKALPDDYASELAQRCLWLMREIGPNILRLAPRFVQMYAMVNEQVQESSLSAKSAAPTRSRRADQLIRTFEWKDSQGEPLQRIPFRLALTGTSEENGWLPRTQRDFFDLTALVQTAHQVIVGLTMGPRESELLDMRRDCLRHRMEGGEVCYFVQSGTFKTAGAHEGEQREWPVVEQVKEAVECQKRLMVQLELLDKARGEGSTAGDHLWGRFYLKRDAGNPFTDTNLWLRRLAESLGMDTAPGSQNLCSHRLRKTLARVVALALTDSPMVLFEIFGHRSIEMTLHYILANKDLRSEIEAIAMEINVMRATEVVEAMARAQLRRLEGQSLPGELYGGSGGKAAAVIDKVVGNEVRRLHRRGEQWGTNNALDTARLLTNSGKHWMLVREGVICTKPPGAAGPCSRKSTGRQETSKCSSECDHRLEEGFLREDVRAILSTSVRGYEQALADDEPALAAYWGGQIRGNISRFPDIEQEFRIVPAVERYFKAYRGEEPSS